MVLIILVLMVVTNMCTTFVENTVSSATIRDAWGPVTDVMKEMIVVIIVIKLNV